MDELKDKSTLNLSAAEILYQNYHYDSVCHPAYYACLQLMSYKLIRKGISLNKQGSLASSEYDGNSHKAIIKEIESYIKTTDYHDKKLYKDYVKKLKEMRERADYKEVRIKPEESKECIDMSKFVIKILNSI